MEYLNPLFKFQGIADLVLSESEKSTLAHTPPERQYIKFFEYWTAKEALLKFLGTGLSLDPTTLKMNERNGSLRATRFPQIVLKPLQVMDSDFIGYLAYASQHTCIVYEDALKLLSQLL